jgi:hypothetical protein
MILSQRLGAGNAATPRARREKEMSTELHRPTAKIYTFPSGGRAPPPRFRETPKSTSRTAQDERLARVEYGDCWYHDAAVVEEADEFWER